MFLTKQNYINLSEGLETKTYHPNLLYTALNASHSSTLLRIVQFLAKCCLSIFAVAMSHLDDPQNAKSAYEEAVQKSDK